MKKLPIGIQTFSELIEENYVYIDKTEQIHNLVTTGKYYFLSRPRRFGKSLLCTTFKALFEGRKELFKSLGITRQTDYQWPAHPIIHIDFNLIAHETPEELKDNIIRALKGIALSHQLTLLESEIPGNVLQDLTNQLFKKYQQKVVLLIDEYDKAILRHIDEPDLATTMRERLKNFYEPIKGLDAKLRFAFITGVSKFSKTSIFSGLNNLKELTLSGDATTLLGYTEDEIKHFFAEYIKHATIQLNVSSDELINQLRIWYDGYFFESQKTPTQDKKIYNPFSILNFFDSLKFSNYWFKTGTPTFLINLIKKDNYSLPKFENYRITESSLGTFETDTMPLETILFQTGYLTIKDYDKESGNYILTYPNKETTNSLLENVFQSMTGASGAYLNDSVVALRNIFQKNNLPVLQKFFTKLYADIPYIIHIGQESYYQTIFYVTFKLLSMHILVEQATNIGRLDAIIQTPTTCYIVEFKTRETAEEAIEQIERKKYYQPYLLTEKKIMLVGIKFNVELRNVESVEWREFREGCQ
jgi:hypothetical protein